VTALCNQPEALVSDLSDDQSHYLLQQNHALLSDQVSHCYFLCHAIKTMTRIMVSKVDAHTTTVHCQVLSS